jgi:hypothetical protein
VLIRAIPKTNVVGGHFLTEDIGLFDAHFFNLSAETAAVSDPGMASLVLMWQMGADDA